MNQLLLFGLLILNTGISAWDAYAAGRIWRECEGFMTLVAWSALVMSLCGFISVLTIIFGFFAVAAHWLSPNGMRILAELTYVMIIVPILGAGLIITIHSWMIAIKERSVLGTAIASYNTYAEVSNAMDAAASLPGFFDDIAKFFESDDEEDKGQGAIIVLIVIVAAGISIGFTYFFWSAGRRHAIAQAASQ